VTDPVYIIQNAQCKFRASCAQRRRKIIFKAFKKIESFFSVSSSAYYLMQF
jgi:hypothetical protein